MGSFSGDQMICWGGPIIFSNAKSRRTNESSEGASTLAGGPGPCGHPRGGHYGAVGWWVNLLAHCLDFKPCM